MPNAFNVGNVVKQLIWTRMLPIELIAKQGGGRVHGQAPSDSASKQLSIHVLLVPQFAGSSGPILVRGFDRSGVNTGFQFSADSLAPGVYLVYAFLNDDDIEYRNPQFLRTLTGGVSVQVEDGSDKEITITDVIR